MLIHISYSYIKPSCRFVVAELKEFLLNCALCSFFFFYVLCMPNFSSSDSFSHRTFILQNALYKNKIVATSKPKNMCNRTYYTIKQCFKHLPLLTLFNGLIVNFKSLHPEKHIVTLWKSKHCVNVWMQIYKIIAG